MPKAVDILIPVFNEDPEVVAGTVHKVVEILSPRGDFKVLVIDDGSKEPVDATAFKQAQVEVIRHEVNRGYGASLKTGVLAGQGAWIGIIDADGTYPVEELTAMIEAMEGHDMVVGVRTGKVNQTPMLRRFPKRILNLFASYLAKARIVDLNSGQRIFTRELAEYLWGLFPQRFSFTSTLTMGAIIGGFRMKELPIDYFKRSGKSSIHPIKDTVRFFKLAFRLGLLFSPIRIFAPPAFVLLALGMGKALIRDIPLQGAIGNLSVTLMVAALQVFMMGVLGELIVQGRKLNQQPPKQG